MKIYKLKIDLDDTENNQTDIVQYKQHGGFILNDDSPNTFLKNVQLYTYELNFCLTNVLNFRLNNKLNNPDASLNILYTTLINNFMNEKEYRQEFTDGKIVFYKGTEKLKPYHINYASLMFLSFVLEMELFAATYNSIEYNIDGTTSNTIPSIFMSDNDKTRIFKSALFLNKDNPGQLVISFTRELDKQFAIFMDKLILLIKKNINTNFKDPQRPAFTTNDIYKAMVPYNDYRVKPDEKMTSERYTFIYSDWKDKLYQLIQTGSTLHYAPDRTAFFIQMYTCVCDTITTLSDKSNEYISEATGFFSYMFMQYKGMDPKKHFGSCITYTLFELYILSRLHTHPENFGVSLQFQMDNTHDQTINEHEHWKDTQLYLKKYGAFDLLPNGSIVAGITHWATYFATRVPPTVTLIRGEFSEPSLCNPFYKDAANEYYPYVRKYIPTCWYVHKNPCKLSTNNGKKSLFIALIFPILDSYNQYVSNHTHPATRLAVQTRCKALVALLTSELDKHK